MWDKIVKSKNLCCQPVVFTRCSLLTPIQHTAPHLPGQFLYPEHVQNQIFFDPFPHLVHVIIEWLLRSRMFFMHINPISRFEPLYCKFSPTPKVPIRKVQPNNSIIKLLLQTINSSTLASGSLKVSLFWNVFSVSSISPKNEQKQVNLRYHSS